MQDDVRVPVAVFFKSVVFCICAATPKSANFASPSRLSRILSALMSLNEGGYQMRSAKAQSPVPVNHAVVVEIDEPLQSMPGHDGNMVFFQGIASLCHDAGN